MKEIHAHRLTLRLFGHPEVEVDSAPLHMPRRKTLALLAYLCLQTREIGREALAALLWPEHDQERASAYLRQALWELNKALGKGALSVEGQSVSLASDANVWVDVLRFEQILDHYKAQRASSNMALGLLEEAVALYRGDFLAGFSLPDSASFDEWQLAQTEALRRRLGEALMELAKAYAVQGDLDMAIASVQRWLAVDPLDEGGHRQLMQLYAWAGQRNAALRQYEACASQLRNELGAAPDAATVQLAEQIRSGAIRSRGKPFLAGSASPEAATISARPQARTAPPSTPFVGRAAELAQLDRLFADPACRLVTLIGPGGIGKTRLAMQFAATQAGAYPHGVVSVSLATCDAQEQLIAAIADALHVSLHHEAGARPALDQELSQLSDYLRTRKLLLVLDDMEHLVSAAELLSNILAEAPEVKLLVTSRERLALPEEWVLEVQGLPYVAPHREDPHTASEAAQLFIQCAQRARANLPLQEADWPAVARICQLVEGAPLGIELAAAWVGVLSCAEIAAELERDLDLLVSRQRGAPERHVSLRAVFEHSWKLLSEAEKSAFAQLAVFRGGFTRAAAAQVAHASLHMLSALGDKSLLHHDRSGRYNIHQLLQQYAVEALERTPAVRAAALERHRLYYLDLLEAEGQRLQGSGQQEALESLNLEIGNVRLALQSAIECRDWERLRQVLAFWILFLEMRGSRVEAIEALQPITEAARRACDERSAASTAQRDDVAPRTVLALALAGQSFFTRYSGMPMAERDLRANLAMAAALPDSLEKAYAFLLNCGGPGLPVGESQAISQQCLAIFERYAHRWGQALAQTIWADVTNYNLKAHAEAETGYQAAQAIFEMLGDRWGQALCLTGLAHAAFGRQRAEPAIALAQAALAIYQEIGDPRRAGNLRASLAQYHAALGDYRSAERYYQENLATALEYGQRGAAAQYLAQLGHVAQLCGDLAAARTYYERSLDLFRQTGDARGAEWASRSLEAIEKPTDMVGSTPIAR